MSHSLVCKLKCTNLKALERACAAMKLKHSTGKHRMYDGKTINDAFIFSLPQWRKEVAVDRTTGEISYDNYNGDWGDITKLDDFLAEYSKAAVCIEAEDNGFTWEEVLTKDNVLELHFTKEEDFFK